MHADGVSHPTWLGVEWVVLQFICCLPFTNKLGEVGGWGCRGRSAGGVDLHGARVHHMQRA